MSDMSYSTMDIGLNGGSVKTFFFTLLTEKAHILFAEEAVRLSDEQVLNFFRMTVPELVDSELTLSRTPLNWV